jgi:hypothetical protein
MACLWLVTVHDCVAVDFPGKSPTRNMANSENNLKLVVCLGYLKFSFMEIASMADKPDAIAIKSVARSIKNPAFRGLFQRVDCRLGVRKRYLEDG